MVSLSPSRALCHGSGAVAVPKFTYSSGILSQYGTAVDTREVEATRGRAEGVGETREDAFKNNSGRPVLELDSVTPTRVERYRNT
jgi:hypothetical protein